MPNRHCGNVIEEGSTGSETRRTCEMLRTERSFETSSLVFVCARMCMFIECACAPAMGCVNDVGKRRETFARLAAVGLSKLV